MQDLEIFPFYKNLTKDEKRDFEGLLRPMSEKKGTIIHYQGDSCKNSLLLVKGSIRLYSQADNFSNEVTLYRLKEGEQCLSNMITVVENTSAIPSAVTETDVKGYYVNRELIEEFIKKIPSYQDFMFSLYAQKVVELTTVVQTTKFKNLDDQIMDYLYCQGEKKIKITHNELAKNMHTSRTVITRVLKKLKEEKKVALFRGVIEILI